MTRLANPFAPGGPEWRPLLTDDQRPASVPASAPYWCRRGCGDWWMEDPRLSVPCPTCGAKAGARCVRPSEHGAASTHAKRKALAWARHPCACLRLYDEAHPTPAAVSAPAPAQPDLFAVPGAGEKGAAA